MLFGSDLDIELMGRFLRAQGLVQRDGKIILGIRLHEDDVGVQLSGDPRRELESEEGRSCRRAVTELRLDAGAVSGVEAFVTNAKVALRTGESVFLSKQSVGWRISAVGCRPRGGEPARRSAGAAVDGSRSDRHERLVRLCRC